MKFNSHTKIVIIILFLSLPLPPILFLVFNQHSIEFETVAKSKNSGHMERAFYVINSENEFISLWNITFSTTWPTPDPPPIDFTKKTLLAVYGGGYSTFASIEITKISWKNNKIVVYFKEELHRLLPAISHPYHIVQISKITNEVSFIETLNYI